MTTTAQARDAAIGVVLTAWQTTGAISADVPMHYDNVKSDKPGESGSSSNAASYARTTVRVLGAGAATQGQRRVESDANITVQVFTPMGDGHTLGDALAKIITDALDAHTGSASGIWFFDVAAVEIGDNGAHFQINASASFRYQRTI